MLTVLRRSLGRPSRRLLVTLGVALASLMLAVNLADFPGSVPRIEALSGGQTILDLMLFASPERAYRALAAYGEAGRAQYLLLLSTVDVALPLLAAAFLTAALAATLPPGDRFRWLRRLPLLALAADYLENAGILALLLEYPRRLDVLAGTVGVLTTAKHALYAACVLLALAGAMVGRRREEASRPIP